MLYPMYFQPLSPQQANPMLYGLQAGTQIAGQNQQNIARQLQNQILGTQAQYAPQLTQQELLKAQLANQLSGVQLQYAPAQNQSEIALRQAQANAQNALPGLYGAEAGEASARAGLTRQQAGLLAAQAPYLVQQEQEKLFTDPVLSRLNQIGLAQKTGMIPDNLLNTVGFGSQNNNAMPSYMSSQNGAPGATPATAPKAFMGDAATNFALFGSPYNPIQFAAMQKGAETQATTGVTQFNDAQNQAAQSAELGNDISNLVTQFQNAYKNTDLTGPVFGRSFAVTSSSQAADNASQNLAATVAKLIAGGRVTNYEMQYINNLKPNRTMTPETAQMTSDYLKQKALRMEEQQSFLNAARTQGVDIQTANTLWNMYNNQRPVYNFGVQQPNTQFQKTWNDYLTPQAVNAARSGQNYVPLPNFANKQQYQAWFKTLTPADQANVTLQVSQTGGR